MVIKNNRVLVLRTKVYSLSIEKVKVYLMGQGFHDLIIRILTFRIIWRETLSFKETLTLRDSLRTLKCFMPLGWVRVSYVITLHWRECLPHQVFSRWDNIGLWYPQNAISPINRATRLLSRCSAPLRMWLLGCTFSASVGYINCIMCIGM